MATAPKHFQPALSLVVADVEQGDEQRAERASASRRRGSRLLIGFRALVSPSLAFTANTPAIEAMTPMARAASGNTRPRAGLTPTELKAATPRMIEATSVTS